MVNTRVRSRCKKFSPIHAGQIITRRSPPPPDNHTDHHIGDRGGRDCRKVADHQHVIDQQCEKPDHDRVEQWCHHHQDHTKCDLDPRRASDQNRVKTTRPAGSGAGYVSPSTSTVAGRTRSTQQLPQATASQFPAHPRGGGSPFVTGRGGAPGVSDSLLPVAPTAVVAVMAPATIVAVTPTVIVVVALPIQGSCAHCCPFPPGNALMRSLRFIRYPPSRPVSRYSQQTASYSREQAGA
jgi:hypothetical protein